MAGSDQLDQLVERLAPTLLEAHLGVPFGAGRVRMDRDRGVFRSITMGFDQDDRTEIDSLGRQQYRTLQSQFTRPSPQPLRRLLVVVTQGFVYPVGLVRPERDGMTRKMSGSCAGLAPVWVGVGLAFAVWTSDGAAQPVPPDSGSLSHSRASSYLAQPTSTPPRIDGVLDDPAWLQALPVSDFRQVLPVEGGEPSERTELRILFDEDYLYIGIRNYDRQPDRIVATQMQRDANLTTDDHITIVIDPFDRARSGFEFQVSAAGGMREGLVETDKSTNYDWRGFWNARVSRDEGGWSAEIAIPFKSISFDPQAQRWGFNVERWIRSTNEQIRWTAPQRHVPLTRLSSTGHLEGLSGMRQGMGVILKPFARLDHDLERGTWEFKPGLTAFYNITSTITLAMTANTDFAEADADNVVVNLTRFPTFFPEKRDFFLQEAGIFDFGGIQRSPRPFFSRRIGIVRGQEKEIQGGIKLTGRHERMRFGFMNVQMQSHSELGSKNLTVVRASVDVLQESNLGFIATRGDPMTPGDNTLGGVDFNFRHRNPVSGNRTSANLWLMNSRTRPEVGPRDDSDSMSFGLRLGMPNEPWRWELGMQQIGRNFNPALGFVQRRDRRLYDSDLVYRWRPRDANDRIRSLDIRVGMETWTFRDNRVEQARLTLPELTMNTRTNEQYYARTYYEHEKLDEPFEIIDGLFITAGSYDSYGVYGGFRTNTSKPAAFRLEGGYRSFYTGDRIDLLARVRLRPSPHFFGGFDYERNAVNLHNHKFTVHILRAQANILVSPQLSWNNMVQWDNRSENLVVNSRMRWEFGPSQELFLVYNDTMLTTDSNFRSLNRAATMKLGLAYWF